ncbi:MAG TPA: Lrp/AsnC family transcriptional regulator [Acidobacteriota bacterium]|nr:Lrp/AsnC family transcriptional regulator [Acidobacteriota bacterium]
MDELLKILKNDALETPENIAAQLGLSPEEVRSKIAEYEARGVIRGYQAVIDEDKLDSRRVTAVIEVKVTPQREGGFDLVARRISKFPEVESVHLVSGAFDLLLFVSGENLQEVASFVSEKLAPLESIRSTASHFLLKTYKHHGILMEPQDQYERLKVSP